MSQDTSSSTPGASSSHSPLSPLAYWRSNFGSDAARASLAANLSAINAAKDRSVAAKKRLGASTKEFRQSNSVRKGRAEEGGALGPESAAK